MQCQGVLLHKILFNEAIWSNQKIKINQSSLKNSMEGVSVLQCPQRPHHVLTWSTLSYEMVFWASGKWPWLWFFKSIVIVISVLKYGEWWLATQTHFQVFRLSKNVFHNYFTSRCDQIHVIKGILSWARWVQELGMFGAEEFEGWIAR